MPALQDNYIWVLDDGAQAVVVDPGQAAPVQAMLRARQLQLAAILLTHHHADHVAGVPALLADAPGAPVFGPAVEAIATVDRPVRGGERVAVPGLALDFQVLDTPGHTRGHIAFYSADARLGAPRLFCGDTLFACGCGRLFEGTPEQMHASLGGFAALPDTTRVHCAHEYTLANIRFALACEPGNRVLQAFDREASALREKGQPTVPTTLGDERARNPFLRVDVPEIAATLEARAGRAVPPGAPRFAALRAWKDVFQP
ncbi:hydroxyacylglutathione hydrolase [Chitinasiproducens palmae]|uniref:hydroxyacylglutathione hydrolase n=1 Tax=Chitinasiproducens palmae TaxID=1770053 RepID=UPI001F41C899|nr:hydroxyacylglutathione hydrolase [Chitinasiproducens palmae]